MTLVQSKHELTDLRANTTESVNSFGVRTRNIVPANVREGMTPGRREALPGRDP